MCLGLWGAVLEGLVLGSGLGFRGSFEPRVGL